jgi:hypothetical protein
MPEIERPNHLRPSGHQKKHESRPDLDPMTKEEDEDTMMTAPWWT